MVILAEIVESSSSFESLIDYRYDVFLSFRGADTGNSFTNHLYDALVDANLETFFDDEEIETEEDLKPELQSAIKASRASIVVLSKKYAFSTCCLDELVLILEQRLTSHQIVIPIFYHVEPTDVRKQQSSFGDAMAKHKQKMETETNAAKTSQWARKIDLWNKALSEVADLKGENANDRLETMLIEDIVKYIYQTLGVHLRRTMGDLIGVDYPFGFISSWLNDGYTGMADVLSISGISGIGKTSLAKYVFERHRPTFHESSFIQDISKRCTEQFNGLIDLQKQLHGDISKTSSIQAHDVSVYTSIIGNALAAKKVLLVLDDIDNLDQLDALLGIKGLHPGSKIIITTKDASLTEKCPLVKPYKHTKVLLKGLNMISSLQLLRFHAFQGIDLKDGYKQVSKNLSKLCEGHPLALKVLGRSLCDRDVAEWEEYIEGLEKETDSHIKKVLRMSFDSLPSQNDKELFKHIACFFIGMDRDYAETILKACGIRIVLGTKNLLDRSLLTIGPSNELMMHQLLQEMGRDLVLQESFDKPWKRSRLWHHKESFKVLKEKKGKGNLLGLALDMRMFGKERLNGSYVLNTDALSKMYNLMLLQLNYVQMDGSYENFPEELRWLCMHGFPLKSIPSDIPMENLVVLDMSYSNIESFGTCVSNQPPCEGEQKQVIGSLKILDLSFCEHLHRLGGFLELPTLERLIVRNCISLIEICESLVECVELVHIDLRYCTKLENLPAAIDKLEKVKKLLLDGCNTCEPQKLIQRNKALTEVADVKRKYVKGRETEFIGGIVKEMYRRFGQPLRTNLPELIGRKDSIEFVTSWLKDGSTHHADILTIYGMGGIGKTSLARYVYLSHSREFNRSSFINDIGTRCVGNFNGLLDLQKQLCGDNSKTGPIDQVHDVLTYTSTVENALASKKVFLVLDDINSLEQLNALLGNKGFHPGSKVIITTKDMSLTERCVLFNPQVQPKHTKHLLKGLHEKASRKLVCVNAFNCEDPEEGYEDVADNIVEISNGAGLANIDRGRVLEDGGGNDETKKAHGIKGSRPPQLAPPPALLSRGMIGDDLGSNWDLIRNFSPTDNEGVNEGVMTLNEVENVEISGMITSRIDRIVSPSGSKRSSDVGDEDEGLGRSVTQLQYSVSPNGKFRLSSKNWQKGELLGSGSFGTVYEGFNEFGFFFAIKEVSFLDQGSQGKQSIIQLEQEISLLSQFSHENIVRYLGTDTADGKLYIFLELVTKGSLARLYQKYELRDSQVSAYTRQILSGLNYLHERKVVHRDIKCANILVDANGSVKLADFGLAKATTLNDIKSCKGSPYWMAPEVVNNRANKGFGLAADIWSLGCTVLEMLTRKIPYYNLEGMQALFRIGSGEPPEIPNTLSTEAQDFILKCLQVNPNDRPTATQLLDHPFLKRPLLRTDSWLVTESGTIMIANSGYKVPFPKYTIHRTGANRNEPTPELDSWHLTNRDPDLRPRTKANPESGNYAPRYNGPQL